jgi:hypothetical protein
MKVKGKSGGEVTQHYRKSLAAVVLNTCTVYECWLFQKRGQIGHKNLGQNNNRYDIQVAQIVMDLNGAINHSQSERGEERESKGDWKWECPA